MTFNQSDGVVGGTSLKLVTTDKEESASQSIEHIYEFIYLELVKN